MSTRQKIKIMYINFSLAVGGIETLILRICKNLDKSKFVAYVCVFESDGELQPEFEKAGIQTYIIEKGKGLDWLLPIKLIKLFKQKEIDVVHAHNQSSWLYGAIAARLANIPLVYTEHTIINQKKWLRIEKILSRITTQITTVADSVAKFMISKAGVRPEKVSVLYNGIDADIYNQNIGLRLNKTEFSIKHTDLLIGNVASLLPKKDHRTLLMAFKLVVAKIPEAKLMIAGEGPMKNDLINLTSMLELKESVRFLGNRKDVPELLKIFNVFVLSSVREGLPMVLLEAMASGLPVVATAVDGNPELVAHGEAGFIVPPGNPEALAGAIISVLSDRDLAETMGAKGKKIVKDKFAFSDMIKAYENIYKNVSA